MSPLHSNIPSSARASAALSPTRPIYRHPRNSPTPPGSDVIQNSDADGDSDACDSDAPSTTLPSMEMEIQDAQDAQDLSATITDQNAVQTRELQALSSRAAVGVCAICPRCVDQRTCALRVEFKHCVARCNMSLMNYIQFPISVSHLTLCRRMHCGLPELI